MSQIHYELGKRDAIVELLMDVRMNENAESVVIDYAKQILENDPEHKNPHAQWCVEFFGNKS